MPRDRETLEAEFSPNGVAEFFYGNYVWRKHPLCEGIDETPGDRIFRLLKCARPTWLEDAIRSMAPEYHSAMHLKAYAYAKAFPDGQRTMTIIAAGSHPVYGNIGNYFTVLGRVQGNDLDRKRGARTLSAHCLARPQPEEARYLLVRNVGC